MEVEMISKELIRPSSPTPANLRTFKFSLLDQLMPPKFYVPIIFFYHPLSDNNLNIDQTLTRLKEALSKTLSEFYPVAGRIKDYYSIDCNDEGILFSKAKVVNGDLYEFFKHPEIDLLYKFLPCPIISSEPAETVVQVAIQVNIFASGGIAIGLCFLHKIIDGGTMRAFLQRFSAIAIGGYDKVAHPVCCGAEKILPPRESPPEVTSFHFSELLLERRGVTRRFVFNAASLLVLKAKATSQLVPNPTRVEVVSGFIWKYAMAASKAVLGSQKSSLLTQGVNIRQRMVPLVSDNTIGNIVGAKKARYNSNLGEEIELHCLVALLREAIIEVNGKYLGREDNEEFVEMSFGQEILEASSKENMDAYSFNSWCNMGFNEVELGWGKPAWVSYIGGIVKPFITNFAVLMDSPSGYGIEAWVALDQHEMTILETDLQFLEFASLNPSIQIL